MKSLILLVVFCLHAMALGCDSDEKREVEVVSQSLTSGIDVKKAITAEMPELLDDDELMRVDPQLASAIGVGVGYQVRVTRDATGDLALYTISGFYEDGPDDNDGRMALAARQRVGTNDTFDGTIDSQVPHPTYTEAEAEQNSEFIERLMDDGSNTFLAVLAPHGGHIEPGTDEQSEYVGSAMGVTATVWRCKGFKQGGGAHDQWHITSTDIHPASFPLLNTIDERGFTYAVSFHGMTGNKEVLIGGAGPDLVKLALKDAIKNVLPSSYTVHLASPGDSNSGFSSENIVNWITTGGAGGIQLEQTLDVRSNYGDEVAGAVASVFSGLVPSETDAGAEEDAGTEDAGVDSGMCYCPCQ